MLVWNIVLHIVVCDLLKPSYHEESLLAINHVLPCNVNLFLIFKYSTILLFFSISGIQYYATIFIYFNGNKQLSLRSKMLANMDAGI